MGLCETGARSAVLDAMIECVFENGYRRTSVQCVLDRSGIARSTFYAHYGDKSDCFLATITAIVEGIEATVFDLERALELAASHPHDACSLLVESHAYPPALEERERALEIVAKRCGGRAVAAAVAALITTRVPDGRAGELVGLSKPLRAWADACGSIELAPAKDIGFASRRRGQAPGTLLAGRGPRTLPPGRKRAPRSLILANLRDRLLDSVAIVVAHDGLEALNVAAVVAEAQTSKRTFYEHFGSIDEAFVAALEFGGREALAAARAAYATADDWREGVRAALAALCGFLAEEPCFARISLVDALGASRAALEAHATCCAQFSELLREVYAHETMITDTASPGFLAEVGAGAVLELCSERVRAGRVDELPRLAGAYAELLLAPWRER